MAAIGNLFMYQSIKMKGMFCFSRDPKGSGLPAGFSPWQAFGVIRSDQAPPHGLSRQAIEAGIREHGFQLWRTKRKPEPATATKGN